MDSVYGNICVDSTDIFPGAAVDEVAQHGVRCAQWHRSRLYRQRPHRGVNPAQEIHISLVSLGAGAPDTNNGASSASPHLDATVR
eukprot:gene9279-biopygen2807